MANLTESYIRKIVREIIKESLILEISADEKNLAYEKSNQRVPFNADLMKQAIMQGREIGLNFKSDNEKYTMPTTKTRIIHPVAYGINKSGKKVVRGLHITGQSEKVALSHTPRKGSAEANVDSPETGGMNAWRMFKTENIKSMWFTDRFFSDDIPGYNPNDKGMSSIYVSYNPKVAKKYQDEIIVARKSYASPITPEVKPETQPTQEPQPEIPTQKAQPKSDKDIEQMGYEDQTIQEKKKNIRGFFK